MGANCTLTPTYRQPPAIGRTKQNRDMYTIEEVEKAMDEYLKLQEQASYYYVMYCNTRRRLGLTTNALDFLNKRDNAKKKMCELKERYNLIFQQ